MCYVKKQLLLRMKGLRFIFPLLLVFAAMSFSLFTEELKDFEQITQNDFVKVFLMGYQGSYSIFPAVILLIATIPYASEHVIANKSGAEKYIVARCGSNHYFRYTFMINFALSSGAVTLGMLLYLLFSFIVFNHNIDVEFYTQLVAVSAYASIAEKSIGAYLFLIIVHCSLFCAVFSGLGLALSFYTKRRFVAWISPFAIAIIFSLFAVFIGCAFLEPMAILDVSRVTDTKVIFIFAYELIVFIASYACAKKKYEKDLAEDEEF